MTVSSILMNRDNRKGAPAKSQTVKSVSGSPTKTNGNDIVTRARQLAADSSKLFTNVNKMLTQLKGKREKYIEQKATAAQKIEEIDSEIQEIHGVVGMFRLPAEFDAPVSAASSVAVAPVLCTAPVVAAPVVAAPVVVNDFTNAKNVVSASTKKAAAEKLETLLSGSVSGNVSGSVSGSATSVTPSANGKTIRDRVIETTKARGAGAETTVNDIATASGLTVAQVQYTLRDLVKAKKVGRRGRGTYSVRCKSGIVTVRTSGYAEETHALTPVTNAAAAQKPKLADDSYTKRVYELLVSAKNPMTGVEVDAALNYNNPASTMGTLLSLVKRGIVKRSVIGTGRNSAFGYYVTKN